MIFNISMQSNVEHTDAEDFRDQLREMCRVANISIIAGAEGELLLTTFSEKHEEELKDISWYGPLE